MDSQAVIDGTRRWISAVVIGLNLCPFARRVFDADAIRYVVTEAQSETVLIDELTRELRTLSSAPIAKVETTLLIHPHIFGDFLDYNDFLDVCDQLIDALGLNGVIQVASFHPRYQFADTDPDAPENYTNRSPFPMLHLLREESIADVASDPDELLQIPERNIETLRGLGSTKILDMLKGIGGESAE
jgi:hypothetical protein